MPTLVQAGDLTLRKLVREGMSLAKKHWKTILANGLILLGTVVVAGALTLGILFYTVPDMYASLSTEAGSEFNIMGAATMMVIIFLVGLVGSLAVLVVGSYTSTAMYKALAGESNPWKAARGRWKTALLANLLVQLILWALYIPSIIPFVNGLWAFVQPVISIIATVLLCLVPISAALSTMKARETLRESKQLVQNNVGLVLKTIFVPPFIFVVLMILLVAAFTLLAVIVPAGTVATIISWFMSLLSLVFVLVLILFFCFVMPGMMVTMYKALRKGNDVVAKQDVV